ncbi:hypothetical protein FHS24_000233 [Psychrobacter luti]|uniref:Uncharacterized protein n=1 Tax=Psychrobacter luti TaxID=198481 RepID=A0A839T8E8_9GAMM|nr:hypothetical protein [Psychrobacter luti]MBB3105742.1 hypothetical protein [Psychrobacter luti]
MKRLAVILAGSTLAMSAHAVNWLEVSESQTGSIFSLDLDSIERSDIHIIDEKTVENITVSIRRTYPAPKTVVIKDSKEKDNKEGKEKQTKETDINHSDQQLLISCKDSSYYRRAYVNYAADDKVLKSWQSEKPILTTKDFKVTKPKTISRMLVEQACTSYQKDK